jgi:hypothetical protein
MAQRPRCTECRRRYTPVSTTGDRCAWRSFESFRAYTWGSVIAANLVLLARHAVR